MQAKKIVSIISLLLISTGFIFNIEAAPTNTVTFRGAGVMVDLIFPEEAHPLDDIYHNLTITAYTFVSPLSISLNISAPVNSSWQMIGTPQTINLPSMAVNQSLPVPIFLPLPQNTNGTLRCTLVVQTNQTADSSLTFYTTQVH